MPNTLVNATKSIIIRITFSSLLEKKGLDLKCLKLKLNIIKIKRTKENPLIKGQNFLLEQNETNEKYLPTKPTDLKCAHN